MKTSPPGGPALPSTCSDELEAAAPAEAAGD